MQRAKRRILEKLFILFSLGMVVGYLADREVGALSGGQQAVLAGLGVLVLAASVSDLWRSDEFERRLYMISTSVAFFGTAAIALVVGVLEAAGMGPWNWIWLYLAMMALATATWAVVAIYHNR